MATLEKIRSKSVLLVVVIGVALLAFIVGDAITNSQNLFGDRTTIAKVGGTKIDHTEYEAKQRELQNLYGQNQDPQMLQQMAIEQLTQEKLLNEAVEKMGIEVSGDMLREIVFTQGFQNPDMQQIMQSLNARDITVTTPAEAYDKIFHPERSGLKQADMKPFQEAWIAIENQAKRGLQQSIYMSLWSNTFNANKLDKQALYDEMVANKSVKYARQAYADLKDEKYQPTDEELKAEYDKQKVNYAVDEPTKRIAVIAVNVAPGDEDLKMSKDLAASTQKALNDSIVSLPKDASKAGVALTSVKNIEKFIPTQIRNVVTADTVAVGSVTELANNITGFKYVKKGNVAYELDSIQMNIIAANETMADAVMAALNEGLLPDSINTRFPVDSVSAQTTWIVRYRQNQPVIEFSQGAMANLRDAAKPYFRMSDDDVATLFGMRPAGGVIIARAAEVRPAKPVYSYDYAEYTLLPSTATQDQKVAELQKYINENATVAEFIENASNAGYVVSQYNVVPSMPGLPMMSNAANYKTNSVADYGQLYDNTASLVGWAVKNGKPGTVRKSVYENVNNSAPVIFAVAVESEFDDYAPLELVKDQITPVAARHKAAEELRAKYAGKKNLDEIAKEMDATVNNNPRFSASILRSEPAVAGTIMGAPESDDIILVEGIGGFYAIQAGAPGTNPTTEYNDDNMENRWINIVMPNVERNPQVAAQMLTRGLRGTKKIDNRMFDFMIVDE